MKTRYLSAIALLLWPVPVFGSIGVREVFNDNMVLQQDTEVCIWGYGSAGQDVTIIPGWDKDNPVTLPIGDTGRWETLVGTPKADGKSYKLTLKNQDNTIVINNVELSRWREVNPHVRSRTGIGDNDMS